MPELMNICLDVRAALPRDFGDACSTEMCHDDVCVAGDGQQVSRGVGRRKGRDVIGRKGKQNFGESVAVPRKWSSGRDTDE